MLMFSLSKGYLLMNMLEQNNNGYVGNIDFQKCPNRACFYKLRAVGLFLTLSESQKGEVWLTIILETQLSLEETFGTIAGECSGIFEITVEKE